MDDILKKLTQIQASAPKAVAKKKLTEDTSKRELTKKPTLKDVFNALSENIAPGQKPLPVMDPQKKQAGMGFVTSDNPAVQNMLKNLDPKDVQIVQAPGAPGQTQAQPNTIKPVGTVGTTQGGQGQAMGAGQQAVQEKDEGKPGKNFAKIAKSAGKRYGSKEAGERVAGAIRAKLAKQGKLEEEQLDELSPKTLKSYAKKADIDHVATNRELKNRYHTGLDPDLMKQSNNRVKGMKQAGDKMMGRANVPANEGAKVDRMVKHIEKSERKLGKSKDTASDIAWATANKRGMLDNNNKKKTNESSESEYRVLGQYDAKTSKGYDTRPVSVKVKATSEKEAKELAKEKLAHNHKNYRPTKVESLTSKVKEADIPSSAGIDNKGAGLGAGRSPTTLEGKTMNKKAKPDFLDMDKDGNKKEPMKKAVADKKKKAVKEGVNGRISAARHEGRADGLRGNINRFKQYDDLEEARAYHDGYKDGLDECYGQGVYEAAPATPPATVGGMANATIADEGNKFSAGLARTPRGGKFSVGGKSFTDRSNYDTTSGTDHKNIRHGDNARNIWTNESDFAFESWNKQLKALVNESEVNEGLSVSISKGQQNSPDSVTITAQDQEADQLLAFVKQAGLGIFGGEEPEAEHTSSAMSIQPANGGEPEANIDVVDGSDGMLSLMKKLGGISDSGQGDEDFADEGGEEEHTCNECGMMETQCGCSHGKDQVDEIESEDQQEFEVAEANAPDTGADNTNADVAGQVGADKALATADAGEDEEEGMQDQSVQESDDEEEDDLEESFTFESFYKKLAFLESTEKEDEKAEKAGKKVTKDIEYDDKKDKKEKVDEWANKAGPGNTVSDTTFEQDIDFMTKVIAGGLNKPKSTGQTTIPVVAGQDDRTHDNPKDWATLAGIKKS